jgi:glycosyltransferase involved in cell wall biosynthesis
MRIGIDFRPLIIGASGGISQLVKGVCEHMFDLYDNHYFVVFCTPFNRGLIEYIGDHVKYLVLPLSTYFQQLDKIAEEESLDVLFRSYPIEDDLKFPLTKQIYLIPDIQHEKFPGFFSDAALRSRRVAFSKALKESAAIGTISNFARQTLIDFVGNSYTDIFLMEPALQDSHQDFEAINLTDLEKKILPQGDYFIFPANIWKHKNHLCLLRAFEIFIGKTGRDVQLILTGYQEGWDDLAKNFSAIPFVHLGFVRPEFLRVLLARAKALVFFSLYEGFGMPLLEAFNAETPVICSNTTSLPEVGQDAVLTCDPTDAAAIAVLMERILDDFQLRDQLIQAGKARLMAYSWDNAAHNLVAACERVKNKAYQYLQPISPANQEDQPLVSIVTPSYNQGRFLKRTIDSVLGQNYPNIEYFVFDGGSTDSSVDILKSYGDQFFWVSASDEGQTDAINKGMNLAKGEILAYLNSDDMLLPGTINKVVDFFNRHPECDLVYGNAFYIDEDDNVTGSYRTAKYSLNRLIEDCMICQPAAFWRSRVKEKIGLFDKSLIYAMDYDYWLRIATQCGSIHFLPNNLACSRLYPETKTCSARSEVYAEIFKVSRRNVGYVHKSYFQGFWHHLVFEKDGFTSQLLRLNPKAYVGLARIHYRLSILYYTLLSFRQESLTDTLIYVLQKVRRKLMRWIQKYFSSMHIDFSPSSAGFVNGYWRDNWLSPVVTIPGKKVGASEEFYIIGTAPIDLVMTVYSGGQKVNRFNIPAHQHQAINLPSKILSGQPIKLRFSNYFKDSSSRKLSFLLEATNLFSERDIG